jgi:hypothetical protein
MQLRVAPPPTKSFPRRICSGQVHCTKFESRGRNACGAILRRVRNFRSFCSSLITSSSVSPKQPVPPFLCPPPPHNQSDCCVQLMSLSNPSLWQVHQPDWTLLELWKMFIIRATSEDNMNVMQGVRFEVLTAVTMKNVVFRDIKFQFVLHRRHNTQSPAS